MIVWNPKYILKTLSVLAPLVFFAVGAHFLLKNISLEDVEIKRVEEPLSEDGQSVLGLIADEDEAVFESEIFEAHTQFNAIALYWKEKNVSESGLDRKVSIRTSLDGEDWGDWMEMESLGPMRDDEPDSEFTFPEVPILVDGKLFQYRVSIKGSAGRPAPVLSDFHVSYIDSRTPFLQKLVGDIKHFFSSFLVRAADEGPTIISRSGWSSPDPYGNKFKGTYRYWAPAYSPVKQLFLHHTVFRNESDPAAAVRAIWEYHAYTRGWGDIGYNYLVDQQGRIYEGRFGGDNVTAGHVYSYNTGSLGVAVLGCFQDNSSSCDGAPPPSTAMKNSLTTLMAWKATNYEINPNTTHTFCGSSSCKTFWTIAGHRDASATACPGNLVYDQMSTLRSQTAGKLESWGYSAKQLTFSSAGITEFNTDTPVTLSFKNTGLETWTNTGNRLLLKTANPDNRTSSFQGSGWINSQTPATLNEATVAPGETGTFTFNLKAGLPTNRRNSPETFRLVLEDGSKIAQMLTARVIPPVDVYTDVAAFYDLGSCQTKIHAFHSTGGSLSNPEDWWSSADYCSSGIAQATSGDFNGDGVSDIAVLYDYGNSETRIHVFESDGTKFNDPNLNGWWVGTRYNAARVRHFLSGDFNSDGKDDLAAFYDYGNSKTRIHVWLSTGSSFAWPGTWWEGTAYNSNNTAGATIGWFDRNAGADIAAFYYYGNGKTRIHVWPSTESSFAWPKVWWEGLSYNLNNATSIGSSQFDMVGYSDVAMFYYYGSNRSRVHVWTSNGSRFSPRVWWEGLSYNSTNVVAAPTGYYSPAYENRRGDLASIYDLGVNGIRIHGFLSSGSSFQPSVWWENAAYNASGVVEVVSGHFGR